MKSPPPARTQLPYFGNSAAVSLKGINSGAHHVPYPEGTQYRNIIINEGHTASPGSARSTRHTSLSTVLWHFLTVRLLIASQYP